MEGRRRPFYGLLCIALHCFVVLALDLFFVYFCLYPIDEEGYLALWAYTEEFFEEKVSFRPKTTAFLDMGIVHWMEVVAKKRKNQKESAIPTQDEINHLSVSSTRCCCCCCCVF